MAEQMPLETIIGLLYRQQVMMISGGSKAYKSWLLVQLAICVASGAEFLRFKVNKGKVLYINFELLEAEAKRRLKQVAKALGFKGLPSNIKVASLKGRKISLQELLEFKDIIIAAGYTLIIIDPIYKLYVGKDENSIEGVSDMLLNLETLAMQTNASIVFAHHFSKGAQGSKKALDRASGSGGFARSPDTLFAMSENADKGKKGQKAYSIDIDFRSFPPLRSFGIVHEFPIFHLDDSIDPARVVGGKRKTRFPDDLLLAPLRVKLEGLANKTWFNTLNNGAGAVISEAQFNRRRKELIKARKVVEINGLYKDAAKASVDEFHNSEN